MITLRQKLYESLLDDEEDLIEDDTAMNQSMINDLNSELYKYYSSGRLTNPFTIEDKHILVSGGTCLYVDRRFKPINNFLIDIDTIKAPTMIAVDGDDEIAGENLCKNIITEHLDVFFHDNKGILKDIVYTPYSIYGRIEVECQTGKIKLENLWLHGAPTIVIKSSMMPEFKNIKIDAKGISMNFSNYGFGDKSTELSKRIDKIFEKYDIPWVDGNTYDEGVMKCNVKNIKTLLNSRRKNLKQDNKLFKVKPNITIQDIFPGLPSEIEDIVIEGQKLNCYLQHPRTYNRYSIDAQSDQSQILSDGWLVMFD